MKLELDINDDNPTPKLGAALIAVSSALDLSIEKLAEEKGTLDLSWLDELRQQSIVAAKGTITEDISIETEADALGFAIELIDAKFQTLRLGLVQKSTD
ncbi:MAG: hypothetical protein CMH13_08805 [Martelella sp.]|uniref:hypothetical protein n=1 Tax=unclassified Martelella TaxID=2629616 RepID=UPI000C58D3A9|nr:hypothetical protein [Martelella sp.]MAU20618.1 hypothetical protein [Martelella sp.]|tara:strand:- start:2838 stop:3134 length:297 start_codon:yes stop_codon:yes gene_type:complete